jgi:hypothetical protein
MVLIVLFVDASIGLVPAEYVLMSHSRLTVIILFTQGIVFGQIPVTAASMQW